MQEYRAENAVELLKRRLKVTSKVKRDGKWTLIPAEELVPGDVVSVRLGDIVPADVHIIDGIVLVDQSVLTGESQPVERGKGEVIYSGSIVKRGEAQGVVIATGSKTYFGKTAQLVQEAKAGSHIQDVIMRIVKSLVIIDTALVIALTAFALFNGINLGDVLPFSLIVLIASVPVALPATFTIAMALGAMELVKKGILVTRLNASEDAASMDVLNLDKTGTLTENRLRVGDPFPAPGHSGNEVLVLALMASDESSQDPIDTAILECAKERGVSPAQDFRKVNFVPFDPSTKRTEAIVVHNSKELRVVKGAPQVIESLAETDRNWYERTVEELSSKGHRVIAVAAGEQKLSVIGLLPLFDRPRIDSREFVEEIKSLGVSVKMVTGDNVLIAKEVAKEVGIGETVCKMSEIREGKEDSVERCQVFAEVYPEDKYTIVKLLQDRGHVVGMTGDGVNDAPALKQAEVGIAVYNSTDVAKASASMVLTHEGLTDIVEAIKTGRRIYQRMLTYTMNKIVKTLQLVLFLTLSFFVVRFFVTTPFDVILLLFLNDFVTMSIATDHVGYSKFPERWNVNELVRSSSLIASLVLVESFIILWMGLKLGLNEDEIHTLILDMLVFTGQFTVYLVRERRRMWSSLPSLPLLLSSVGAITFTCLISILGILVTPLPPPIVLGVLGLSFGFNIIFDQIKLVTLRLSRGGGTSVS